MKTLSQKLYSNIEKSHKKGERAFLKEISFILLGIVPVLGLCLVPLPQLSSEHGAAEASSLGDITFFESTGLLLFLLLVLMVSIARFLFGVGGTSSRSFLGGVRSAITLLSAFTPLLISLIGIVAVFGSLSLGELQKLQGLYLGEIFSVSLPTPFDRISAWGIFCQPIAFAVFSVSLLMLVQHPPFNLSFEKNSLFSGVYFDRSKTEKLYLRIIDGLFLALCLVIISFTFLGGYRAPGLQLEQVESFLFQAGVSGFQLSILIVLFQLVVLGLKALILFALVTILQKRSPVLTPELLLRLGWRRLLPWSIVNVAITIAIIVLSGHG